jgi:hypothetical protein
MVRFSLWALAGEPVNRKTAVKASVMASINKRVPTNLEIVCEEFIGILPRFRRCTKVFRLTGQTEIIGPQEDTDA